MLGASDWAVRGPQMIAAALSSLLGCIIGGVLLLATTLTSVPLLEEAFELTLMPHWSVFAVRLSVCFLGDHLVERDRLVLYCRGNFPAYVLRLDLRITIFLDDNR